MALDDICFIEGDNRISVAIERGNTGTVDGIEVVKKDAVVEVPKSEANFSYG